MTLSPQTDLDHAYREAQRAQADGNLEDAQRRYESVLRAAPAHPQTLTMLATVCYQLGDDAQAAAHLDDAIAAYRHLMRETPNNQPMRAGLANLLLARERIREAEKVVARLSLPLQPIRADMAEFERLRQQAVAKGLPSVVINAMPKSASESIWNKLARGLGLAQCYVSLGLFPDCCAVPGRLAVLSGGGIATKEHLPASPHNLTALRAAGLNKVVVHVRDPRQAMLSWAHFVRDDVARRPLGALWRKIVPPATVLRQPMTAQLDWHIAHYLPVLLAWCEGWRACADDPSTGIAIHFSTFERFTTAPDDYFSELLAFLELAPDSFDRDAEVETVHLRKGQQDEWRNVLSETQQERAFAAIPESLSRRFAWTP